MQELVKVNCKTFLKRLSRNGFRLLGDIEKNEEFPICVDFDLKTAYRLTSIGCLACFAMAKNRVMSQDEFFSKHQFNNIWAK